jgi:hypothetical protein
MKGKDQCWAKRNDSEEMGIGECKSLTDAALTLEEHSRQEKGSV